MVLAMWVVVYKDSSSRNQPEAWPADSVWLYCCLSKSRNHSCLYLQFPFPWPSSKAGHKKSGSLYPADEGMSEKINKWALSCFIPFLQGRKQEMKTQNETQTFSNNTQPCQLLTGLGSSQTTLQAWLHRGFHVILQNWGFFFSVVFQLSE